eukprot:SAG22_NODE_1438_length_4419_cov_1.685880_2_plen_433_part_00
MGRRGRKVEPLTVPWDHGSQSNPLHRGLFDAGAGPKPAAPQPGPRPAAAAAGSEASDGSSDDDDDDDGGGGRGCRCLHSGKWSCRPDYAARGKQVEFFRIKSPAVRSALQRTYTFVAVYRRRLRWMLICLFLLVCFGLFGIELVVRPEPQPPALVANDAVQVGCLEANSSVRAETSCIAANLNTWRQFDGTARALFAAAAGRPAPPGGVCAEHATSNQSACTNKPPIRTGGGGADGNSPGQGSWADGSAGQDSWPDGTAGAEPEDGDGEDGGEEAGGDATAPEYAPCELPLVLSALAEAAPLLASWPNLAKVNSSLPTSYSDAMLRMEEAEAVGKEQTQRQQQLQQQLFGHFPPGCFEQLAADYSLTTKMDDEKCMDEIDTTVTAMNLFLKVVAGLIPLRTNWALVGLFALIILWTVVIICRSFGQAQQALR